MGGGAVTRVCLVFLLHLEAALSPRSHPCPRVRVALLRGTREGAVVSSVGHVPPGGARLPLSESLPPPPTHIPTLPALRGPGHAGDAQTAAPSPSSRSRDHG